MESPDVYLILILMLNNLHWLGIQIQNLGSTVEDFVWCIKMDKEHETCHVTVVPHKDSSYAFNIEFRLDLDFDGERWYIRNLSIHYR